MPKTNEPNNKINPSSNIDNKNSSNTNQQKQTQQQSKIKIIPGKITFK